jgi:branched-chain amino acid transport system permease protein
MAMNEPSPDSAADTAIDAATPAPPASILDHRLPARAGLAVLAALVAFPFVAVPLGAEFYVSLVTRILAFAIAATSLNLILGFGGMVSFGHAAFVGIGAYAVAILMKAGTASALVAWPAAIGAAALAALLVGAISLRTHGVYFIMITLAFAQMLFFLAVSIKTYGGDEGLPMAARSTALPGIDLSSDRTLYFVALALAAGVFLLVWRLVNSRFGHALQGIRENETRMHAIGFPVLRLKLAAFVIAGGIAGLAGALIANHGQFVSPAMMQWSQSGILLVMVVLGGVGHLWGAVAGAFALLLLEEGLSHVTSYWQFFLGAILLAVVLVAPNGLMSLRVRPRREP